jgi:hypothetical protein
MTKQKISHCPDCGLEFIKTTNKKRCKPCALKAHGQTGTGYSEKVCACCQSVYKPTSATQKVCENCRPLYFAEQNMARSKAIREKKGSPTIGSIKQCKDCGDDFVYIAGPQSRCSSCQKHYKVSQIHEWLKKDIDRLKKYTTKAKDNYMFSGNRGLALERDNFTCQKCGTTDDLHIHHIDGNGVTVDRNIRNDDINNLVTLCRTCHTTVHHQMRKGEIVEFNHSS